MTAPTVLLVDDQETFVETMAKRLRMRHIEANCVYSGMDCLKALKINDDIEVIILDIKMPVMDGLETLKEIKKGWPLIEVIMLTGHATIESAIQGMKLGAFDFLMKPCDIDELVSKLTDAADKKRAHEEKIKDAFKRETLAKYGPFYYA